MSYSDSSHGSSYHSYSSSGSDASDSGDAYSSSSSSSSSSSIAAGKTNYLQAKKGLCLDCNSCTMSSHLPFFTLARSDVVLPAPKLLQRQQQHLEGWGADLIRRGGLRSLVWITFPMKSWTNYKVLIYASHNEVSAKFSQCWKSLSP